MVARDYRTEQEATKDRAQVQNAELSKSKGTFNPSSVVRELPRLEQKFSTEMSQVRTRSQETVSPVRESGDC
jgi:hypothetical protein